MSHRGRRKGRQTCKGERHSGGLSKQCPKADSSFWRRYPWLIWLLPILGLASLIWFLIRVIPKPSRATYPCQRLAAPLATGFIIWATGLIASTLAYRKARQLVGRSRYVIAGVFAAAAVMTIWLSISMTVGTGAKAAPFIPTDPPNTPMGDAKGIYPGRVMWIRDANATSWNGSSGSWWDDNNTDQATVDNMISTAIQGLTGAASDADAWDTLFRHFNETRGLGDLGYQTGEKIAVKINMNQDSGGNWSSRDGMPSPHVVYSFVKQLINVVGIPGSEITIYDASRYIGDPIYDKVRSDANADFRNIRWVVSPGQAGAGRIAASGDATNLLHAKPGIARLPQCVTQAKYLVNMALLRAHSLYGVTLCAKNHFGSTYFPSGGGWTPSPLHGYGDRDNAMASYNCLVNLNGHKHLGGKTLLYFIDGLYPARNQSDDVITFKTFDDDWFSSILLSQDPVAIDSVGLDFLHAEQNAQDTSVTDVIDRPDNYLHEMAQADSPPSGTEYDPENDGTKLTSLGVHEHWNNAIDRQYSRNLGTADGIELVTKNQLWASQDGPVRNVTRQKRYDFIQYAINDARNGDEIVVPQDVYTENISLRGKNITVRSTDPNDPNSIAATVVSGLDDATVTFQGGEDADCILSGLTITGGDIGVYCSGAAPTIRNCIITGNAGAGLKAWSVSDPTITGSTIAGNGGVGVEASFGRGVTSYVTITNATIVGNAGGGIFSGIVTVANSIIYYNDGDQIGDGATVTYSDVQGGYPGDGNLDCDPCFADPCNGDYHLKSENGRWSPLSQRWVFDDVTSLCIDGGDPASNWKPELWPHGQRINMGAYGGTPEASMSLILAGNAADFDFDNDVDFCDFNRFAESYKREDIFLREDIDRNGRVDGFDIKAFADQWLWPQP